MPLLAVALRFRNGHFRKALLVRLAPVDADAVHRRQDDEGVGLHELCELGRGKVLIDDGGRAVELAVPAHNGDAAAADRDHDAAAVDQGADGVLFDDVHGLR